MKKLNQETTSGRICKTTALLSALTSALLLTACGGGGGSDNTATAVSYTPALSLK
jgi:hypothetical protein